MAFATLKDTVWAFNAVRSPVWRSDAGPAMLASAIHATRPRADAEASMPAMAVGTMSRIIRDQGPAARGPDAWTGSDGFLSGMFFGVELGCTLLVLRPLQNLGETVDAQWQTALLDIAQRAVDKGETAWYANGNLALKTALLMGLCWRATGDKKWYDRFQAALEFAQRPGARFPGEGLMPSGVFTEKGTDSSVPPGFDPGYALFQGDFLATMCVFLDDPNAKRLARGMWPGLQAHLTSDGKMDMSVGTRHAYPGSYWDLETSLVPWLDRETGIDPGSSYGWTKRMLDPNHYRLDQGPGTSYGMGVSTATGMLVRAGWKPPPRPI